MTSPGLDRWQELREAAAVATPGPWGAADEHGLWGPGVTPSWCVSRMGATGTKWLYDIAYGTGTNEEADARYIAAANPAVILSLLGVVDRQARQLAAVEKCIADMRFAADLARSRVPAGEPSFVAEAIHEACNNVAAALAGGETNNDH